MFKVGDKVRRIGCPNHVIFNGVEKILPVGAVRIVKGERNGMITVSGFPAPFGSCFTKFELVQEAPTSRANDPATSKGKRRVNKYEQSILTVMNGGYYEPRPEGWAGKELAKETGHPLNCITPRFAPLRRKGLIKDSGIKRDKQIVWVLA